MKKIIALCIVSLAATMQVEAYTIKVRNELDGPIAVNITENNVTKPHSVRPREYFSYITSGCYTITLTVTSGRAVGQMGGIGDVFTKACRDYKVIARFLPSPTWDPLTGKRVLEPSILELREE